jgi:subtilisin family serine protease
MKKIYVFLLLSLWVCELQAQNKYWIVFKDKSHEFTMLPGSSSSITDIPVDRSYIDSLQSKAIAPMVVSRWLNAVSAFLDENQIQQVQKFSFVEEIVPIDRNIVISAVPGIDFKPEYYSTVLSQIGAESFVGRNLSGKGVKVGVIDVGFYGVTANKSLRHLIEENKIADIKDFVNPHKNNHFSDLETNADYHGNEVLQMIAGFEPEKKLQYGLATNATFYLARTDHGTRETRSEEDNWIAAMEHMDSLGVRLINTSLGYALGFTDSKENYKPVEMDGKTSMISRATQIASEEKGMLIIVSAGNEGDDPNWKIVSTPADAEAVLSVGSTKAKSKDKISYSSIGPEFLSYLKPNVACFSPSGTSFSAPVITGFAACLMEAAPDLTNKQLKHIIEKSGHLYPYGNNYVGYGVPNAAKALQLLKDSTLTLNKIRTIRQKGDIFHLTIENTGVERAVVFHKKNQHFVLKQELLAVIKGKLSFKRHSEETRTTIDLGNEIVEVFWEE